MILSTGGRRLSWLHAVTILAGMEAVAVAAWLVPASVHVVSWTAAGPFRVALFAPQSRLIWLMTAALVVAAALVGWSRRVGLMPRVASVAAALCVLWVWTIPFLPWLPDRVPALLLLTGPVRWVVAGAALVGTIRIGPWLRRAAGDMGMAPGRRLVFVLCLSVYLILGTLSARAVGPGGDEPHYLIISHSLLTDGDLRIENNHERRDYRAFHGGPLRPDYLKRGRDGAIYSIHGPGLPVLLLPAYAAAGYAGAVLVLCFMAALAALAVFDLATALAGPRAGAISWAAVCLTVPFLPHTWLIFPEMPAAFIVAWSALWLWQATESRAKTWVLRGIALGMLPWLHTKFILFLVLFGGALLLRVWRRPRLAMAFITPIAVSVVAWLYFFYLIYGSFNPEAPYGAYTRINMAMWNIPRGLLGLLFDQKFGLLVYSPIYLFAVAGCWIMLRRKGLRWLGLTLLLATAVHVGSTTRLYMWWGGSSAPARFLVPILPCLAPMIAVAASGLRGVAVRALLWASLSVSLVIALVGVASPERLLLFSDPHGRARIIEMIQGAAPLSFLLPTFTEENWRQPLADLAPWLVAAAVALATFAIPLRSQERRPTVWLCTMACLAFLFSGGVLARGLAQEARDETSRRGALELLGRYDANRLWALEYRRMGKIDQEQVFRLSTIVVNRPRASGDPNQRVMAGPFALPPGSYEARVWFADARPRDGEIVVSSSDRAVFGRADGTFQNLAIVPFDLPVTVRRVAIAAGDSRLASAFQKIEIVPAAIVPPSAREEVAVRAIESIAGRADSHIVYVNEHTYPEGGVFWTRGTGPGSVLVAPGDASKIILTLYTGPLGGPIRVMAAGNERTVHMTPGELTQIVVDVPRGLRLVPITVQSTDFFRPAEVDPASDDTRGLGCQVRITLE